MKFNILHTGTLVTALLLVSEALLSFSCNTTERRIALSEHDSLLIVQDNLAHRSTLDDYMRHSPDSPFNKDTTIEYHGLKWFPINPYFRGRSILHRYTNPETVIVLGTKGEERKNLRYGYFEFDVPDEHGKPKTLRINVYKFTPHDKRRYDLYKNNLSIWFTDRTTGKETYGVGRYIELGEEHPDLHFVYTIDLNQAFNPYCAYSDLFSCAIPRKEDHLEVALRVGEMKYHE